MEGVCGVTETLVSDTTGGAAVPPPPQATQPPNITATIAANQTDLMLVMPFKTLGVLLCVP